MMARTAALETPSGYVPAPRSRAVVEGVQPQLDSGDYPIKRVVGEEVVVEADAFTDGHDLIRCTVRWRHTEDTRWSESWLEPLPNDHWRGEFVVDRLGLHYFTVQAWIDRFGSWRRDLRKRIAAQQNVSVDLLVGAQLVEEVAAQQEAAVRDELRRWSSLMRSEEAAGQLPQIAENRRLGELMQQHDPRRFATEYEPHLPILVEPERARFSTWYEMFPRSASPQPGRHGTFRDVEARLPYVVRMGFDVLYLPPIHPIGRTHRKGKNNAPAAAPDDVGSPWAIGAEEGGHKAIHPALGTLEDFRHLLEAAARLGIQVALDIALQCSPDHPYLKEHPEWFLGRPDGTIQYAENPPKKYQDIYPFHFETENWRALWDELKSIFFYWIDQGVRIFRVDNPHTKPFTFWQWVISEIKRTYPEVIFLSEAFTRPKVMYELAKLGFTQSYTYFTWRTAKHELTEYMRQLTSAPLREFLRPNLWPNTPDILTEQLQVGGRPVFMSRLVLAATLGASYGIYGPAFEHCVGAPREPGSEEYLDSEKYQLRHWDVEREDSLAPFIARVNQIRRSSPALQTNRSLEFLSIDNDQLLCYAKHTHDYSDIMISVVNLDPHHRQAGTIEMPLEQFGLDARHTYQMHDLLGGGRYLWHGPRNYVELDPQIAPAHIFRVRRQARTERDFEYFL